MLNKVPEVTVYFWIIKVLATTVGETAADFLNDNLGPRPDRHDARHERVLLVVALVVQFRLRPYVPGVYWLAVVLISVVGTLITDNLVDNFGVALEVDDAIFAVALARDVPRVVRERADAVDPHHLHDASAKRSTGSAILFTFALGTAAGDLVAEQLNLGYWKSALLFGGLDRRRRDRALLLRT